MVQKRKEEYQVLDTDAPITKKQIKKRKAQIESQVDIVEQVRDHQLAPLIKI